jgi:hypothetical protein
MALQPDQLIEAGKIQGYNWASDEIDLFSFNAHCFYRDNLDSDGQTWLDYLDEPSQLTAAQKLYGVLSLSEEPKPADVPMHETRGFWQEVCGDRNPDADFLAGFATGVVELFNSRVGLSSQWLRLEGE